MLSFLILLSLAQTGTPYETLRLRMEASLEKQRESIRKQAQTVHQYSQEDSPVFFTTPWPRPVPPPEMAMESMICDPIPPAILSPLVASAAQRNGLTDQLIRTVIRKESAGYPCAVSTAGAMGLMQLMPETAHSLGVNDPWSPKENIDGGTKFLKSMLERYGGNLALALSAYNAGPGNVDRYGGMPPFQETQNYVKDILKIVAPELAEPVPAQD